MPDSYLYKQLNDIKPSRIAVVGDIILDQYLKGEISRISPEAPVGVLDCLSDNLHLGGAANVAGNLAELGCKVSLIGVVGKDETAKELKKLLKAKKIETSGIVVSADRPTTKKTRLMAQGQQLMRVDREKRLPIPAEIEKKIAVAFELKIKSFDGIVVSDYNKGLLTNSLLAKLISTARKNGKLIIIDPKGDSYSKYKGADIITPNRLELERASGIKCDSAKTVEKAARTIIKKHKIKSVLATLGADGMALFSPKGKGSFVPTFAREVYDVTGAGDTVIATFAFALLGGLSPDYSARLSNHAGGLQVARLGAVSIGLEEIRSSLFAGEGSKVVDIKEAAGISAALRKNKKKIVFTNGCFDLIHYGHIQYLQQAKKLGDWLVLALNSDLSVRKLKGKGRPVLNENDRAHIMAAMDCVDQVIIFKEPTPIKLIKAIKPDFLVKGGDYKVKDIAGYGEIGKWGGKVKTISYKEGKSTSGIIEKIAGHATRHATRGGASRKR